MITRPLILALPNHIFQWDVGATKDSWGPPGADGDVGGGHKKYIEGQEAETIETMIVEPPTAEQMKTMLYQNDRLFQIV